MNTSDPIGNEIRQVSAHSRAMFNEYLDWGGKMKVGEVQQWMYNEIIDFVNFRMETAHTCLQLIESGKIADALGLCRPLLEHYLLLRLMCRGRKYFRLEDKTELTTGDFKKYVAEKQAQLAAEPDGKPYVAVSKYARLKGCVMYVFEGLAADDDPDFVVPVHYFHFKEFRPEAMRLKSGDYFEYVKPSGDAQKAMAQYQSDATAVYRRYLSYDALLTCLELNGLADQAAMKRIEAHYTFLGQFLHPTADAARALHEDSNYHQGQPIIGMHSPYSPVSVLLTSLYVCCLIAGMLDEVATLIEDAPVKFVAQAGTDELRPLITEVPRRYSYFWFLFNDPPLYDKFQYCSAHVSPEELQNLGHYSNVPNERVPFDQHICEHLKQALSGWSNNKCGVYTSPLRSVPA
jgi:hypothetical protein